MAPQHTEKIPFSALPLDPKGPRGNAWGRFGATDQLGMLNLLTPAVVAAAAQEIKTGVRISLDWPMDMPTYPSFDRDPFSQAINNRRKDSINDDVLTFNTQCSSQWDGFRHYAYQDVKRFYNNRCQQDFNGSDVLGLNIVAEHGGIVGRGILIDYAEWACRNSIEVQALESTAVKLQDLQTILQEQSIIPRQGDIIFVRSGFTQAYNKLDDHGRRVLAQRSSPDFAGVEATKEVLAWVWNTAPAAVAGDAPSFERAPIRGSHANPETNLHEWFLGGWGLPIGELFDLEALSAHCKRTGRYSFFLSSVPLKVPGGVASPPCAVAIF